MQRSLSRQSQSAGALRTQQDDAEGCFPARPLGLYITQESGGLWDGLERIPQCTAAAPQATRPLEDAGMHTQDALGCLPRELCWVGAQRGEVECARAGRSLTRSLRWFHDRSEMHVVIPVQFSAQTEPQ
ncbi:hypothetical protein KIL84_020731 [Mauremys mutica]|uniref:Uncharacterized protein n=1 Tax=Mauremys mutica TaxID=74926 RepID=A0A9D3XAN8_9SAUR|nr:hypothetical protein KIL84_020731 [Mauremys mutica]